ncbi:MAG TPA: HAMP domain-containing sensor histidine kinase [Pirellulaceae bacterium]|nr:HAMP domain-containing sensor histidine kinase [Pirellulaceae bacterium]HMO91476.1 HAMP domain-containing sensor histidine kinase [Pirellulaceae bacterium]HMP70989.1 HAMP domain-containing sensor histidine kinase [Pirellulaceae bacterium]
MSYLLPTKLGDQVVGIHFRKQDCELLKMAWFSLVLEEENAQASEAFFDYLLLQLPEVLIWVFFESCRHDRGNEGFCVRQHSTGFRSRETIEGLLKQIVANEFSRDDVSVRIRLGRRARKKWIKSTNKCMSGKERYSKKSITKRFEKFIRQLCKRSELTDSLRNFADRETEFKNSLFKLFRSVFKRKQNILEREWLPKIAGNRTKNRHCTIAIEVVARMIDHQLTRDEWLTAAKLRALKEFAYGASHEINNPLANIVMRAQMLAKDETDPQRRQRLAVIEQQAMRAHEMISQLMFFVQPSPAKLVETDLVKLIEEVVNEFQDECLSRSISSQFKTSFDECFVCLDPTLIKQAITNLIRNGIESIQEAGDITLSLDEQGGAVTVSIMDDGRGIPPVAAEHIFDPFYSGREAGRGLGFGLPVVWRIMELHGGKVNRVSVADSRTCFTLVFDNRCIANPLRRT